MKALKDRDVVCEKILVLELSKDSVDTGSYYYSHHIRAKRPNQAYRLLGLKGEIRLIVGSISEVGRHDESRME